MIGKPVDVTCAGCRNDVRIRGDLIRIMLAPAPGQDGGVLLALFACRYCGPGCQPLTSLTRWEYLLDAGADTTASARAAVNGPALLGHEPARPVVAGLQRAPHRGWPVARRLARWVGWLAPDGDFDRRADW